MGDSAVNDRQTELCARMVKFSRWEALFLAPFLEGPIGIQRHEKQLEQGRAKVDTGHSDEGLFKCLYDPHHHGHRFAANHKDLLRVRCAARHVQKPRCVGNDEGCKLFATVGSQGLVVVLGGPDPSFVEQAFKPWEGIVRLSRAMKSASAEPHHPGPFVEPGHPSPVVRVSQDGERSLAPCGPKGVWAGRRTASLSPEGLHDAVTISEFRERCLLRITDVLGQATARDSEFVSRYADDRT